jgi:phasin family protein
MQTPEQFATAQKTQVATAFTLAAALLEGLEKAAGLHLQTAKSALGQAAGHAQAVLDAKDPQALFSLHAALLQPGTEQATAYARQAGDIASATGAEVGKIVEAQVAELQKSFVAAVDAALQNAPAGSEDAVALLKSTMAAAGNAYDSVQKVAKQAAEAAAANFEAVTVTPKAPSAEAA